MDKKLALYNALQKRYEAQVSEAFATLAIYFETPVGIGEHAQIVDEMAKQLEKISNAEGCLAALEKDFKANVVGT
jgi:precorrin-3B methylase